MSFDTKKMIIAVIIVGILFVLFLGYAFNSIQKVDFDIEILADEMVDNSLLNTAQSIIDKSAVEYVDNISLNNIDVDILLVNHQKRSACIIKGQSLYAVNYEALDKSIVYCNSFLVSSAKRRIMIINCDEILGDATVRAIANAYHYEYASTNKLSPNKVQCFQTVNQDEEESFYRYAMIESAKKCYFADVKLDELYYFYDQWTYLQGTNNYQEVINYDYYDGFKAYAEVKVMMDLDENFDLDEYINSYKNDFGIYSKDDESKLIGMLWCLLTEKQGKEVLINNEKTNEIYKMLFEGVPQGHADDESLKKEYHTKFAEYKIYIENTINEYKDDVNLIEASSPIITAEKYSGTIKVEDNYYIYTDYAARDSSNNLIEQDYVLAELTPYKMSVFLRDK